MKDPRDISDLTANYGEFGGAIQQSRGAAQRAIREANPPSRGRTREPYVAPPLARKLPISDFQPMVKKLPATSTRAKRVRTGAR